MWLLPKHVRLWSFSLPLCKMGAISLLCLRGKSGEWRKSLGWSPAQGRDSANAGDLFLLLFFYFWGAGREDVSSGEPLAKAKFHPSPPPSFPDLIARAIHLTNTKLHLEREKDKKGDEEALQTVITRVMLRVILSKWLLGEEMRPQSQITPRGSSQLCAGFRDPVWMRGGDARPLRHWSLAAGAGRVTRRGGRGGASPHCLESRDVPEPTKQKLSKFTTVEKHLPSLFLIKLPTLTLGLHSTI